MTDQNFSLNQDTDAFIVIRFTGLHSANLTIHPANVSPLQMMLAGILLQEQGKASMLRKQFVSDVKDAFRELEVERRDQILVPTPKKVLNAK